MEMTANQRRRKLEVALADLVRQIDLAEYRDELGHALRNNLAYLAAEKLIREFGLSHKRLCGAMDDCGLDPAALVEALA